jgi:hypothetical protein
MTSSIQEARLKEQEQLLNWECLSQLGQNCKYLLRRVLEESGATEREYRLLYSTENSVNGLCANNSKQAKISEYFK